MIFRTNKMLGYCFAAAIALFLVFGGLVQSASSSEDVQSKIQGKWEIAPNKRVQSGTIIFKANRTYEMDEHLQDGDRVGKKGEYKIDTNVSPFRIDICLNKCNAPGAEWVTLFCIFRFLSDGKLEICSSPDSNHPTQFDSESKDGSTMILTRVE